MTLEEALAEIINLKEKNKELSNENDTYKAKNTELQETITSNNDEINKLREYNMSLYLKVDQAYSENNKDNNSKNDNNIENNEITLDDLVNDFL